MYYEQNKVTKLIVHTEPRVKCLIGIIECSFLKGQCRHNGCPRNQGGSSVMVIIGYDGFT